MYQADAKPYPLEVHMMEVDGSVAVTLFIGDKTAAVQQPSQDNKEPSSFTVTPRRMMRFMTDIEDARLLLREFGKNAGGTASVVIVAAGHFSNLHANLTAMSKVSNDRRLRIESLIDELADARNGNSSYLARIQEETHRKDIAQKELAELKEKHRATLLQLRTLEDRLESAGVTGAPETYPRARLPAINSTWRHNNGRLYKVVTLANLKAPPAQRGKYPVTVIYRNEKGKWFTRPAHDWHRSMTQVWGVDEQFAKWFDTSNLNNPKSWGVDDGSESYAEQQQLRREKLVVEAAQELMGYMGAACTVLPMNPDDPSEVVAIGSAEHVAQMLMDYLLRNTRPKAAAYSKDAQVNARLEEALARLDAAKAAVDNTVHARLGRELLARRQLGIRKYGTDVERTDLTLEEWLQHMLEEMLDGAVYARRQLDMLKDDGLWTRQGLPPR